MRRLVLVVAALGCGAPSASPDAAMVDAAMVDTPTDTATDKASTCASTFGNALTNSFGRLDGTVLAVVPPDLQACAQPNSTHLVLQITMNNAAYRMVVNVDSINMHELDAPLAGPAWHEGWYPTAQLDYVSTLQVHSGAFVKPDNPVARITDQLELGAHVSVFATSSGGTKADSAHLVHRNAANADGAIVIAPDTAPHYLLFRFDNQSF